MKNLKKKITTISIAGIAVIVAGVLFILNQGFGIQATAARYAFVTQTSTTFETGPFLFDCDGEAITYPSQHDGQVMELELDHDLISSSINIDVKNFVGTNYTTQDISYIVSINDGTNSNHVNYNFSINDVAVGNSDVSQPRTISGGAANTDTISLKFERTTNTIGGDTINIKIKSLAPYEKEIVFQIRIILPLITVNFDANGGNVSVASTQIRYLSQYSTGTNLGGTLPTPTKSGYYFAGWYEDGSDFDYVQYYQMYTDIYNAFGGDQVKTTAHWIGYGVLEGRDGRRTRVKDNTLHTYSTVHAIHAMWVPLERVVEVYSSTSNNQTVTCTTSDGQTFIDSTTRTSHGIVMLSSTDMSISYRCIIKADGYLPYDTGMITKTSKNFAYDHAVYTQGITYVSGMTLTPAPVTVSFDANGGTVSPSSKQVTYLSNYGDLPTPTKQNYVFDGWYYNGNQVTSSTANNVPTNHTLTAAWVAPVKLIFNYSGGSGSVQTVYIPYNQKYQLPTPDTLKHYEFAGWYSGNTQVTNDTVNTIKSSQITEQTLTAHWNSLARQLKLVSTANAVYSGDQQTLQCMNMDIPGAQSIIYSVQNMPSSGTQEATGTIYLDDGDFHCSVTADGYWMGYSDRQTYSDPSAPSMTITLSPTKAPDIATTYNNTNDTVAANADITNYRNGYYLIELWGGTGGNGYNYSKGYGGIGGTCGYTYGTMYLSYDQILSYSLGGDGKKGESNGRGTPGGANGGGLGNYNDRNVNYLGGSGGGYSSLKLSGNYLMVAAGGGGAGGPAGGLGGQEGGDGGNGGTNASASSAVSGGTVFHGSDGETSRAGTGGTTSGGTNKYESSSNYHGSSLQGGQSYNRGGGGGGGWFGGGGGTSVSSQSNNPTGGGGGGSSFISSSVTFSGLSSAVTSRLSGTTGDASSTGGSLKITYLGKTMP